MNPDVSQTFNILRNLVPVKGKMVHSHNGYRMYDLENVRVSLDADEDHDTVNLLGDKQLLGWTISRMKGQTPQSGIQPVSFQTRGPAAIRRRLRRSSFR